DHRLQAVHGAPTLRPYPPGSVDRTGSKVTAGIEGARTHGETSELSPAERGRWAPIRVAADGGRHRTDPVGLARSLGTPGGHCVRDPAVGLGPHRPADVAGVADDSGPGAGTGSAGGVDSDIERTPHIYCEQDEKQEHRSEEAELHERLTPIAMSRLRNHCTSDT